jgi:peptidoglycan hydrolase CwlO-like protein
MKGENEKKLKAKVDALKLKKSQLKGNMESAEKKLKGLRSAIAAKKKQMAEYVASRSPKAKALGLEIAAADKQINEAKNAFEGLFKQQAAAEAADFE